MYAVLEIFRRHSVLRRVHEWAKTPSKVTPSKVTPSFTDWLQQGIGDLVTVL